HRRDTATRLSQRQIGLLVTCMALALAAISSLGLHRAATARESKKQAVAEENKEKPAASADNPAATNGVGKVRGRVVHEGKPLAGADVRLLRRDTHAGTPPTRRTTSNDRGEFAFAAVTPGEYRVWCFHGNLSSRAQIYHGDSVTVAPDGTCK